MGEQKNRGLGDWVGGTLLQHRREPPVPPNCCPWSPSPAEGDPILHPDCLPVLGRTLLTLPCIVSRKFCGVCLVPVKMTIYLGPGQRNSFVRSAQWKKAKGVEIKGIMYPLRTNSVGLCLHRHPDPWLPALPPLPLSLPLPPSFTRKPQGKGGRGENGHRF